VSASLASRHFGDVYFDLKDEAFNALERRAPALLGLLRRGLAPWLRRLENVD
jgi:hypothetical protein